MIRVLQVVDGLGWGGTKEQTYLITRELSLRGIEVHVALSFQYELMVRKLREYPVKLHFFENHNRLSRLNLANYYRLWKILKEEEFDIVIANSPHALDFVRLSLLFLRKKPKVIAYKRTGKGSSQVSKLLKYSVADRIVVVDRTTLEKLRREGFFPERLVYIPSGLDLQRFRPVEKEKALEKRKELGIPPDWKVFINVANWNPEHKGQPLLIEAFSRLNCRDCILLLVGLQTDDYAPEYAKRYGLEGRLLGLGFREDVPELINMADFFVFSSYFEGVAGAVLQAMACGKLVISTLAGGIADYVKDGENALAVPVGDLHGLVQKMRRALGLSKEECESISRRAIETAREYSIEKTVDMYIELFRELLGISSAHQSSP
ncbi:MAG: glycosyltransferase family 4 protein [Aquificaceae bacterium]|uniref:glycosyltransferase family 4 protein n=1 Tax=Hydrogenobacter sp. Uz 6-8 TaxID=3384828 RepID=UPI0030A85E29